MKLIHLIILLVALNNACTRDRDQKIIAYTPVTPGKCNSDTLNTYHYIQPSQYEGSLPLLILLDSGGDGLFAVKKVEPAVLQIPCVIIGSDLVRNNYPGFEKVIEMLISDACQKFKIVSEQVFIAGFSGGARMAFEYARKHHVMGVLMCGAGPSVNSYQELPCPVYMIAGTADFNFPEMYYNPLSKSNQQRFLADYFRGRHEWPPADRLKEGLLFLMGRFVRDGERLLKQQSALLAEIADSLLVKDETLFAVKAIEKSLSFNPDNKPAKKLMERIKTNRKYIANIQKIESDLALENKICQAYSEASMKRDSIWWANEIKYLSQEIAGSSGDQKDHFLRIKAFLGILFYSRLNNLIHSQPDNKHIVHLLITYRMAEPDNPDVFYYYALYTWKLGKEKLSKNYMTTALALGFKDYVKLENDFPAEVVNEILPKIE
jgi:hypothetical protein